MKSIDGDDLYLFGKLPKLINEPVQEIPAPSLIAHLHYEYVITRQLSEAD